MSTNKSFSNFGIHSPKTVYVMTLLVTLVLALMMPRINIDTDPENMLPADQPDRVFHNQMEKDFVLHDAIVVGLVNEQGIYQPDTLASLYRVSKEILGLGGVIAPDLMSLSEADNITQAGPGTIRFERMMATAPETQQQAEAIQAAVARLPLLQNTLVSEDGKAAAIYVPIQEKSLSYPLSQSITRMTERESEHGDWHITGLPVAEDTFGHEMFVQMGISAPLAGVMIFILLWYFFRNLRLIISPMIVAMATVIGTMGLLIGMGFTVHIMSSMIAIFLMPIAVVDSVHILSEFADRYESGDDPKEVIAEVVSHLFKPMLFTSLTSAVGFASLLLTPIPPVQIFGAFVAFGILLAFVLTILFVPAWIVRSKPASLANLSTWHKDDGDRESATLNTPMARAIRRMGSIAASSPRLIILAALAVLVFSAVGVSRISINDNPVRWFEKDHRIRVADDVLNQHFAGTYDAFMVFQFDGEEGHQQFISDAENLAANLSETHTVRQQLNMPVDNLDNWYGELVTVIEDALFEDDNNAEVLEELLTRTEQAQSSNRYFQNPDMLAYMQDIQAYLNASGLVGKSNALPDIVKVVNRELHEGRQEDYIIPDSQPGVAQTLLQFLSSHRPQDLWHSVTPDYSQTAIWLQLRSGDNQDMSEVIDVVDHYIQQHPLPDHVSLNWAGKTYINVIWQQAMVNGMLKSLLGAFVVVFLMMVLLFRSVLFALLAMLPLSLTILTVYGMIGWIGKDYDMPIAVLSSLTLGLSIDFAIHFIQRLRSLHRETGSLGSALKQVFEEPARAISRNAVVIALGFSPLFFAPLIPYVTVGAFMVLIMSVSAVTTLLLLPALAKTNQRFLFRGN